MKDEDKTKEQLINELAKLRQRIAELETLETDRKRAEQERERLNAELAMKNKELEQILYVTSHTLRSPLVNVQGFSKELEHTLKDVISVLEEEDVPADVKGQLAPILTEDIPFALNYILSSVSKMDSLLTGISRLSRLGRETLNIELLDMNRLMSDVIGAFNYQIKEKGIKMEIGELPSCQGDETKINQMFSNLFDNALKYLDPHRSGVVRISGRKQKGQSIYCVEDNGIGISREHQERIFQIFHRFNPEDGLGEEGLGLTIVKRTLDRLGGKIWVESEPGKGSKFYASLPARR